MPRNVTINHLRGTFAHMPVLNPGELYFCTDTMELYGGASSNQRIGISNNVKTGTGSVAAHAPSAVVGGPTNPSLPKAFAQINIGGTVYWVPLFQ